VWLWPHGRGKPAASTSGLDPDKVVVAVFDNRTGDASLDSLGIMVSDIVTQGLRQLDGVKLAEKRGYQGQPAASWIADMTKSLPERAAESAVASTAPTTPSANVLDSLDKAIETARGAKRPILLVVARPGDKAARSHSDSLISDPEFAPFVQENFIVAHVPPTASSGTQEAESMENLLGGVELAPDAVELIVTDDGQTPLFSQSGAQPPARIVHGLRRFLAARQASRFGETAPRR
jgi:hypothetical protein